MAFLHLFAILTLSLTKNAFSSPSSSFTCKQLEDTCFGNKLTFDKETTWSDPFDPPFYMTAVCRNFKTFSQLNASACFKDRNASFWSTFYNQVIIYHLIPNKPVALDKSFDLMSFNELIFNQTSQFQNKYVTFKNTLCLDLDFFTGKQFWSWQPQIEYRFDESTFNFCKNRAVIAECDHAAYTNSLNNSAFGYMVTFTLMKNAVLDRKWSPWAFKNAYLNQFSFFIFNHFIYTTRLEFCQDPNTTDMALNSIVNQVKISGYNIKLDTEILHPPVFKSAGMLNLNGVISSIQVDLFFLWFDQLKTILINVQNLKQFFHRVGMDWSQYLNIKNNYSCKVNNYSLISNNIIAVTLEHEFNSLLSPVEFNQPYSYPDADFCLFSKFPVDRIVMPLLSPPANTDNCSCLYFWLIQNYPYFVEYLKEASYFEDSDRYHSTYWNCIVQDKLFAQQCLNKSDGWIKMCNIDPGAFYQDQSNDKSDYDIQFSFYTAKYFISIICAPLLCIIGLLLNAIIIHVVRTQKKELKDAFFDYMKVNACFNCLYCAIYLTELMSECVWFSGIYCSAIRTTMFAQYFKIVVIEYFGNAMKICGNVTYILMNVNRYMLIGKDHNKTLTFIAELNSIAVGFFLFLFSGTLSIANILSFDINIFNEEFDYPTNVDQKEYTIQNGFTDTDVAYFILTQDIVNSFVFCITNLTIEIIIVKKLKKELDDKKNRMDGMMTGTNLNSKLLTLSARARLRKKQNESTKVEQKAMLMTSVSSFLNIFLRLPEMLKPINLIVHSYFMFTYMFKYLCHELDICDLFIDMTNVCFILTLCSNYFIYYYFNKKFREAVYVTAPAWVSRYLTLPKDSAIKPTNKAL
jgi:hypothetical protein